MIIPTPTSEIWNREFLYYGIYLRRSIQMRALKRLLLGLTILAAVCTSVVFFSCKRSPPKVAPGPRNLTPGLSEALTELAKQRDAGFIHIIDRSGSSEEAKNLAALIAKALGDGGWTVIRNEEMDRIANEEGKAQGLLCSYSKTQKKIAEDLVWVLEQKGLRIYCQQNDAPILVSFITIEVGVNQ